MALSQRTRPALAPQVPPIVIPGTRPTPPPIAAPGVSTSRTAINAKEQAELDRQRRLEDRRDFFKAMVSEDRFEKILLSIADQKKVDRHRAQALAACNRTPKLLDCAPYTFKLAILRMVELDLDIATQQVSLVPKWDKRIDANAVNVWIGYKGRIELGMRSGQISWWDARVVTMSEATGEDGYFEYELGTNEHLIHQPSSKISLEDWNAIAFAYSIAKLKDGSMFFRVLTKPEIQAARDLAGTDDIWKSHPWPMAKKTTVQRHASYMPYSLEMRYATAIEDSQDNGYDIPSASGIDITELLQAAGDEPAAVNPVEAARALVAAREPKLKGTINNKQKEYDYASKQAHGN